MRFRRFLLQFAENKMKTQQKKNIKLEACDSHQQQFYRNELSNIYQSMVAATETSF